MAWLSGWQYRKSVTISGSTGAGTNYQVFLKVGESSGATGYNFHLNGHSASFPSDKNQGGDLRFTSSDGSTLLDFWVEKVVGTSPNRTAYIWVEVSDDLSSNRDIYCYFGNSSASNASNGSNTFIFFDDFDSFNSSNWDVTGIVYSVSNSIINFRSSGAYFSCLTYKVSTFSNLRTRCLVACSGTLPGIGNIITKANSTASSFGSLYLGRIDNNGNYGGIAYIDGGGNWTNLTNQTKTITDGTYYVVDFSKYSNNLLINIYNPDYSVLLNSSTTNSSLSSGYCGMWSPWSNKTQYSDWFFVSKYIFPEPVFSSAGSEEPSSFLLFFN